MGELKTRRELAAAGWSARQIAAAVRDKKLFRAALGVYCTGPVRRDQRLRAIVLGHPSIIFSGVTAAEIHLGKKHTFPAEAVVERSRGRSRTLEGMVEVRQAQNVTAEIVDGLPVVPVLRAAIGAHERFPHLARELLAESYPGKTGEARLAEDLAAHPRIPKTFRAIIAGSAVGGDSKTERRIFQDLRAAGLKIRQNVLLGPYRYDGEVLGHRTLIEIDSYTHHAVGTDPGESGGGVENGRTFVQDRWKQNYAVCRGYRVLRYSATCVDEHSDLIVEQVLGLVRGEEPSGRQASGVWEWHETFTSARWLRERGGWGE